MIPHQRTISAEIARMRLQFGDDWMVTALIVTMTELAELKGKVKELGVMVSP